MTDVGSKLAPAAVSERTSSLGLTCAAGEAWRGVARCSVLL